MAKDFYIKSVGPRGNKTYEVRRKGSGSLEDYQDTKQAAQRIMSRLQEREDDASSRGNPKQPSKRVRKALTKYVKSQQNPRVKMPTRFTPAEVRVNGKGEVQIRMNPAKLGTGKFAKCVKRVESEGGAYDARAVCASAGRKKFGAKKFAAMAKPGRARNPQVGWNVYLGGKKIDTVFYEKGMTAAEVKATLVRHDGYDARVTVKKSK